MVKPRQRPGVSLEINNKPDFDRKYAQVEVKREPEQQVVPEVADDGVEVVSVQKSVRGRKKRSVKEVSYDRLYFPSDFVELLESFLRFYNFREGCNSSRVKLLMDAFDDFARGKYPEEFKRLKAGKKL